MKRRRRQRGAVSVFLVIILVPCLLVTSIFVDVGRVYLSRSAAEASADLALNTLMTNYDADLNDWYGMIASCQNIEQFYDVSAEYFMRTLKSQNLSDEEIVLLSDYYASVTGDDTIYDYLSVEAASDTVIQAVEGADLTNAAMLKSQIVDFMKYRAPITVAEGIIAKLNDDSTGVEQVLQADENKPLVDQKDAFYTKEGELTEAAFQTYKHLYQDYTLKKFDNEKLQAILDSLQADRAIYREINGLMISNLYETGELTVFTRPTVQVESYAFSTNQLKDELREVKADYATNYYIDWEKLNGQLTILNQAISDFKTKKSGVVANGETIPYTSGTTNDIQYWRRLDDKINSSDGDGSVEALRQAGEKLVKEYVKTTTLEGYPHGEGFPEDWDTAYYNGARDEALSLINKYLTPGVTDDTDGYLRLMRRLESISAANIDKIDPAKVTVSTGETMDAALERISDEIWDQKTELEGYVAALQQVIDGDGDKLKSLEELKTLADEYEAALLSWENTAEGTDTSMAEADREEIDRLERECADQINETSVGELQTRLENIISQLQGVIDTIDTMNVDGVPLTVIWDYGCYYSAACHRIEDGRVGLTNAELNSYAEELFSQVFVPYGTWEEPVATLNSADSHNAQLDPGKDKVNVPELYLWMHGKFNEALNKGAEENVDNTKNEEDAAEEEGENMQDEALDQKPNEQAQDIARDFSPEGTGVKLGDMLSSIVAVISQLSSGDITDIRDDLYIAVYMLEMFSYHTYTNEGKYALVGQSSDPQIPEQTELSADNVASVYGNAAIVGTADTSGTWLSSSLKDHYNKTLTNHLLHPDYNAAFECELEYILYGGTNEDNIKDAYNDIFTIRYALNVVSAFANFWTYGNNTTATALDTVAGFVSAATSGIIPAPAIKVVMLAVLTVLETSNDLNRLSAGFPVELYKAAEDWQYSLEGMTCDENTSISDITSHLTSLGGAQNPTGKGLQYSDYMTLFIITGMQSDKGEAMTLRMAEVIQANMRKLTGSDSYRMANARVYFELKSTLRVDPLLMTLPIFYEYEDEIPTGRDWCTYDVHTVRGY